MVSKKALGLVGIGALALVGGTFAYFTQTATIDNPFDTARYGTTVYEDFKPQDGKNWQPGVEINKDLYVKNTGDRDVVVRVKFEDFWSREGKEVFKQLDSTDSMTVYQADPDDGCTEDDLSVVHKIFNDEKSGDWTAIQSDGYYYYKKKLAPGEDTGKFLDKVKLDADTDMGKFMTQYYYTTAATMPQIDPTNMDGWEMTGDPQPATASQIKVPENATFTAGVTDIEEGCLGYGDASYTLRITVETVQATDKAVESVFSSASQQIKDDWNLEKEELE